MISKREIKFNYLLFALFALVIFTLTAIIPYSGDDWAWGSQAGLERMRSWFSEYNGRYIGNLIVIILTRMSLLKALIETLVFSAILLLIVPPKRTKTNIVLVSMILFLAVPKGILVQTVAWTSGFSNYGVSTLCVVLFLCYTINQKTSPSIIKNHNVYTIVIGILFGIIASLIVENITLYFIVISLLYAVYYNVYKREKNYFPIGCFLGAVAGAFIMFSNNSYETLTIHPGSFRTLGGQDGFILKAVSNYLNIAVNDMYMHSYILNISILITCIVLFTVLFKRHCFNKLEKIVAVVSLIILACTVSYSICSYFAPFSLFAESDIFVVNGIMSVLFYLACTLFTLSVLPHLQIANKKIIIGLFLSVVIIVGPLLLVSPIGSRCFLVVYILEIFFVCECLKEVVSKNWKTVTFAGVIAFFVCSAILFSIYYPVSEFEHKRLETIRTAVDSGKKMVVIKEYPNEDYLWYSLPIIPDHLTKSYMKRYKMFYDLPEELKIVVLK